MDLLLKRRLKDAGLPPIFSPHSFRVLVVTDLLSQDVPLEDVQYLAGHANPRTTQIFDRRRRQVTQEYCGEDFCVRGSAEESGRKVGACPPLLPHAIRRFTDFARFGT